MNELEIIEKAVEKDMKMKWCSNCSKFLPVESFSRHANTKDGLQVWCKPCHNKKYNKRKVTWQKENRQTRKEIEQMKKGIEARLSAEAESSSTEKGWRLVEEGAYRRWRLIT